MRMVRGSAKVVSIMVLIGVFSFIALQVKVLHTWQAIHNERDQYGQIRQELLRYERLVSDVDNGFRGFVLTREGRFLKPMVMAEGKIPNVGERLVGMATPWPRLQSTLVLLQTQVEDLVEAKRRLAMDLALGRDAEVLRYIREGQGLDLAEAIAQGFREADETMTELDRQIEQARDEVLIKTHTVVGTAMVGTFALGMSMTRLLRIWVHTNAPRKEIAVQ